MEERLQKLLSRWGVASRRQAESLIQSGRVVVNGEIAQLGQKADPDQDRIQLDGRELSQQNRPRHRYILLHKPLRVVSTCQDPQGRKTVLSFLPAHLQHQSGIHPVGRLDYNSTGALLLTNDGDLTYQLTHPRHHIPKTYRVVVAGRPSPHALERWRQGITLSGYQTLPADVTVVSTPAAATTELEVILWEGRNRQIRRTAEYLGHPVKSLHRVSMGPIHLHRLAPGQIRELTKLELSQLRQVMEGTSLANDVIE